MSKKEKLPFWLGVVLGLILGMSAVLMIIVPQMDRSESDQVVLEQPVPQPLVSDQIALKQTTDVKQADMKVVTSVAVKQADSNKIVLAGAGEQSDTEKSLLTAPPVEYTSQPLLKQKPLSEPVKQEKKYGIALVLDDVGYDLAAVRRILDLSVPVAISILPESPFARQSATLSKEAGQVVMLHLPMQPEDPSLPMTDDFLHGNMTEQSIRDTFLRDLEKVPFVEGVNNHMGSKLTQQAKPMHWVMSLCQEKGLFFVDSRTSARSVAATTAESLGLAWASRSIFLDHEMTLEAMKHAWQRARNCAKKKLSCVVIAHPRAKTITFLENYLSKEDAKNMVSIRHLLQTTPIITQTTKASLP